MPKTDAELREMAHEFLDTLFSTLCGASNACQDDALTDLLTRVRRETAEECLKAAQRVVDWDDEYEDAAVMCAYNQGGNDVAAAIRARFGLEEPTDE